MKSVIDIPDAALLATADIHDLIGEVTTRLRIEKPDVVCLPLIDFGGANYASRYVDQTDGPWSTQYSLEESIREVRGRYGAKVYLSIAAPMNFLNGSSFVVRDQYSQSKTGVCLVNPYVQHLLRNTIAEAQEKMSPDGIVIDLAEINGQTAEGDRIEFTCFCPHCIEALSRLGKFDYSIFRAQPNPANLALLGSQTGISHFSINLRAMNAKDIVSMSKVRDIFNPKVITSDAQAEQWGQIILDYTKARCKTTASAINAIGQDSRKAGVKLAVITNVPRFDWTSGVDLDHLQSYVDEVWTDPDDLREQEIPPTIEMYHYLSSRARYFIDAYFELASDPDKLAVIAAGFTTSKSTVPSLLADRSRKVLAASQVKLCNVAAIKSVNALHGYVAAPMTEKVLQKVNSETGRLVPEPKGPESEIGAAKVLLFLMQLAQRGQPITLDILQQVAQRLGVFNADVFRAGGSEDS